MQKENRVSIRKRTTYQDFEKHFEFLEKKRQPAEIIARFYKFLDGKNAFRSSSNSRSACESINQLFKDKQV